MISVISGTISLVGSVTENGRADRDGETEKRAPVWAALAVPHGCCHPIQPGLPFSLMEIVFSVTQEADGGFVAECLSHDIFTQGDSWDQLRANVREAVNGYFFDQTKPSAVRLHLVRDEVLAVG